MAVIKVTYNQISRRFDISSNTTWITLESQLRSLFKLPINSSISLSYTDEDGDAITLSSDLELFEVLSSVHNSSDNNSNNSNNGSVLKFVLDVHEYDGEISRENDNSWVLEGINNDNNDNNNNGNNDNNDSSSDKSESEYNDNNDNDDNNDNNNNDNIDNIDHIDSIGNIDNIDSINKKNKNNENDIEAYFINDIPERKEKNARFTTDHDRGRGEYEEYKPLNENNLHVTITEEAEEPTFEPNIFSNNFRSQNSNHTKNVPPKQQKIFTENQQLPKPETIGSSSKSSREENNKQEDKSKDEKSSPQESPYNRRHLFIGSRLPLFVHPLLYNRSRFSPFGHHHQPSYLHTSHSSFSDSEISCPCFSSNPRFNSNNNCCNNNSNNNCIIGIAFKGIVKAILSILLFITLMKLFFAAFCPLLILFLLGKLWTKVSFNNLRPYPESFGFGRCASISVHCKNDEGEEKEDEEDENELRYFSRRFGGPSRCHRSQFWQQRSEEFKRRECQQQQQQQHEINKKLETLKSMGFNLNDEILEGLVKRSNGNLERVVERLLASQ